ncbi:LEAF RUST 10 DISEASE-RESISTANCE LOCUS RECEPTOR-LIKE PROTEIN KINASE-like 2.7 [Phragmites australis]|uniref:LEAF RUST 10 DISEASE-RESISTANCE LOCUS RECEPTOR-LIKE PROTEIN KINASE-like 2.7 n=1 Tax=Phragmites australis TaxID=29695 RepID=UPI002D769C72|nr:LEAF RUST 10 DISEASE-RESISTANCE LOCUS RECEPTOR-LIKE PROTEIN KINASE-like 2.7 [Phragmites australis]
MLRFLLIAVSLAASGGAPAVAGETYYNASMCRTSFACGDNVDVHYPFFLANATRSIEGYTAYSYCGYPGMAITCEGGRATLRLKGDNYTVLNINYGNHTVTVADADVLSGGDCPRVTHNVTVPPDTWLNFSATANENLVFFYDCVFTPATPQPTYIDPINCTSFPEGKRISFVAAQPVVRAQEEWPVWARACKPMVVVPVLRDWLLSPDPEYLPRLNNDWYGQVLKQGFQLSWDPSAGPCYVCEDSKGQCSYNQIGEFVGCQCSDGRLRLPGCARVTRYQDGTEPAVVRTPVSHGAEHLLD